MKTTNLILISIFLVFLFLLGIFFWGKKEGHYPLEPRVIESFEECATLYPVLESYPRRCHTPEGEVFVEDIGNELEKADLIRVNSPRPNEIISSPLQITGEARGTWYFEADFPVRLYDSAGRALALGVATAQDDWMTTEFVPFELTLTFDRPETQEGFLIFEKDDPVGLPESEGSLDSLIVPVRFDFSENR